MKAHKACYTLPSLNIDNTDWQDDVKASVTVPVDRRRAFAVLVDPSPTSRRDVTQVVERIHEGVQSSHGETATILAEWEGVNTDKTEEFVEHFNKWKLEKDWQGELFICVREPSIVSSQVEIVFAKSRRSVQLSCEEAGELLASLDVGSTDENELAEMQK